MSLFLKDALQNEHGTEILGSRIIVEWSHGNKEKVRKHTIMWHDYHHHISARLLKWTHSSF